MFMFGHDVRKGHPYFTFHFQGQIFLSLPNSERWRWGVVSPASRGQIFSSNCFISHCSNCEMWKEFLALTKCLQGFEKCSDCKLSPEERMQRGAQNRKEVIATVISIFKPAPTMLTILHLPGIPQRDMD